MLIKELLLINWNEFVVNLIIAAILLAVGILLGNIVRIILKKIAKKSRLSTKRGYNFFKLFIAVVTWSIYILFANFALVQLDIPVLTGWLTSILLVIPALTSALILIVVGFVIASYLSRVIEESRIEGGRTLAQIFWYFVLYIFLIFAFKTALISVDTKTVNYLLLILTAIVGVSVSFIVVKKIK